MALSASSRALRASGRVSWNWYWTRPSGCGTTSSATRPVRIAALALSADSTSTASPESARAAAATRLASGDEPTTAMCTISAGRLRNAIPRPIARRIGNAKVQNSASGSRMNSLNRTDESWTSESEMSRRRRESGARLLIAELSPGEMDEHVLECRRVSAQLGQLEAALRQLREQRRHGAMELTHAELPSIAIDAPRGTNALEAPQTIVGQRVAGASEDELDDMLRT